MKWITRWHVHVDRVACPWRITGFADDHENLAHPFDVYDALCAGCRLGEARNR
jgi:hypothetical protein